ncbi:MAG: UbiH/UbiF/VisC/COQ6 family ubiquinone biosynthesis hydroxylase [Kiloniellales bacterium]|nr:UbiH/UbiF/VisC/COQ6 family ubiquinone biosynthesis hydroxylase [Kiloniellales bacterium]MDJ0980024.1 UbiH/UbiF/VisC/COQ6 family ubiquinone biosynthesis hydroxylase [Kiloniellales bacterium]
MAGAEVQTEVLIVGGGMVGLTLGCTLAGGGVPTVVLERRALADTVEDAFDGRASAIAQGSRRALDAAGLWAGMAPHAQPILDIRVSDGQIGSGGLWEGTAPLFLHYDHREVGDQPLGYIVENRAIRLALNAAVAELPALTVLAPATLEQLDRSPAGVEARLADGGRIRAQVAVGAEGRRSRLRTEAGIRCAEWSYPQTGIVCTISHDEPHHGVAHEHFLPAGPFAVLPMVDDAEGRHRSSIVWTERRDLAEAMLALDDDAFSAEMQRRFGDSLGRIRLLGRRWSYPLSLLHAERYIDRRLALVGDAAHGIHPIAGQGLNLGLRDVAVLAETLVDARRLGLDLGGGPALARYQRWRRFDNVMLTVVTDGLNRLFSNDLGPLRLARDLGLSTVGRIGPLKRLLMRHAMGLEGDLPRLTRGQPL